jgi:hypothetical protein
VWKMEFSRFCVQIKSLNNDGVAFIKTIDVIIPIQKVEQGP